MKASRCLLFAILVTNFILVSCSDQQENAPSSTSASSSISDASSSGKTDTISSSGSVTVKKISVSSRCIGCGKCARIDASHFQMNGRKAESIQASGNQSALNRAIDCCPVSAISAG